MTKRMPVAVTDENRTDGRRGRPKVRVQGTCPVCGTVFENTPARLPKYCSVACQNQGMARGTIGATEHTCSRCEKTLPIDQFRLRPSGRPLSWCKPCTQANAQQWMKDNPERARHHGARYRSGMSLETIAAMYATQGGLCAICRAVEPVGKRTHLDHNHRTMRIRGLLCQNCNMALGMLHDDLDVVRAMVAYLEADLAAEGPADTRPVARRHLKAST